MYFTITIMKTMVKVNRIKAGKEITIVRITLDGIIRYSEVILNQLENLLKTLITCGNKGKSLISVVTGWNSSVGRALHS